MKGRLDAHHRVKQQITLRIDQDVIEFFKMQGKGYQRLMNFALRAYMLRQKAALAKDDGVRAAPAPISGELARLDWLKFGEKFRGAEQYVKDRQRACAELEKIGVSLDQINSLLDYARALD